MESQEENITETDLARCIFIFENMTSLSLDDVKKNAQNKEQFKNFFYDQTISLQNATSDVDKAITNIQQRRVKVLNKVVKSHFSLILTNAHKKKDNKLDYLQPLADQGMAAISYRFLVDVYHSTKKLSHDILGDGGLSLNSVLKVQDAVQPFEPYQQNFYDEIEDYFLEDFDDFSYNIQDFIEEMDITDIVDVDQEFDEVYSSIKKIKQKTDDLNRTYDNLDKTHQMDLINKLMEIKYRLFQTIQVFYDSPQNGVLNGIIRNKGTD